MSNTDIQHKPNGIPSHPQTHHTDPSTMMNSTTAASKDNNNKTLIGNKHQTPSNYLQVLKASDSQTSLHSNTSSDSPSYSPCPAPGDVNQLPIKHTPSDDDIKQHLETLTYRIQRACLETRYDSDAKRQLFVELELLRLDYIERTDVYPIYLQYQKLLANKQSQQARSSKSSNRQSSTTSSDGDSSSEKSNSHVDKNITNADSELKTHGVSSSSSSSSSQPNDDNIKTLDELEQRYRQFALFMSEFNELRKQLYLDPKVYKGNQWVARYKAFLVLLHTIVSLPAIALFLPLRAFAPIFRLLGVNDKQGFFYGVSMEDYLQKLYARGILYLTGVTVVYEGLDNIPQSSAFVGMYNHESNLDPIVIQSSPYTGFKYIAKNEMKYIPVVGQLMYALGHIFIDRKNLEAAKKSLEKARLRLITHGDSIAIAPEGTRSKTGRLSDFKKGPFHTAISVGLPIMPMVLENGFELWAPSEFFTKSGVVRIRFLPPVQPIKGEDHNQLSNRIRRIILQASLLPSSDFKQETVYRLPGAIFYPLCWFTWYTAYTYIRAYLAHK